jgi:hypothetical protein
MADPVAAATLVGRGTCCLVDNRGEQSLCLGRATAPAVREKRPQPGNLCLELDHDLGGMDSVVVVVVAVVVVAVVVVAVVVVAVVVVAVVVVAVDGVGGVVTAPSHLILVLDARTGVVDVDLDIVRKGHHGGTRQRQIGIAVPGAPTAHHNAAGPVAALVRWQLLVPRPDGISAPLDNG